MSNERLGELLLSCGMITSLQLEYALSVQDEGERIAQTLVRLKFVDELSLLKIMFDKGFGVRDVDVFRFVRLVETDVDYSVARLLDKSFCVEHSIFPFGSHSKNTIKVAVSLVFRLETLMKIEELLPRHRFEIYFSTGAEILEYIHRAWVEGIDFASSGNVEGIFEKAVMCNASDIHLDPLDEFYKLRLRIDGVLHDAAYLTTRMALSIVNSVKARASMDINVTRHPQDGYYQVEVLSKLMDCRVSTSPTVRGEAVVIRLLAVDRLNMDLEFLGFSDDVIKELDRLVRSLQGLIIICGATGQGKTSTIYSLLSRMRHGSLNIMTYEDPVEFRDFRFRQINVGSQEKLSMAEISRSMLRQDPDVVLLGEIRDSDSAIAAFRIAMTGHLVLSTLHANSALGILLRLHDLGIDLDIISQNVIACLSQRLVRRVCSHCGAKGCERCFHTGFKGRLPLVEILDVDDKVRGFIQRRDISGLEIYLKGNQKVTMSGSANLLLSSGLTVFEEVCDFLS